MKKKTCSICRSKYDGFGCNAWPFKGRCCNACDSEFVLPARLERFFKQQPVVTAK